MEQIKSLLSSRLIILTGKGGVGKSTIAASLALVGARLGMRVLVVEWAPVEQMSKIFGAPEAGYDGGVLTAGIHGLNLDPSRAFREYMLKQVRLEKIYKKLFENSVMKNFINFIPGLNDLMCLGKVYEICREKDPETNKNKYDLIIFDGTTSAQTVFMLQTPSRVAGIARIGPIEKHCRAIIDLLGDSSKSALCVVTKPEELSVTETEEFLEKARKNLNISTGPIIVNAIPPGVFSPKDIKTLNGAVLSDRATLNGNQTLDAWLYYADLACRKAEKSKRQMSRLRRNTRLPLIKIPYLLDGCNNNGCVTAIADYIEKSL